MDPPSLSCHTIEEVIDDMNGRWRALQRAGDWRAVFAKTYLRTTEQILVATRTAGVLVVPLSLWGRHGSTWRCVARGRWYSILRLPAG